MVVHPDPAKWRRDGPRGVKSGKFGGGWTNFGCSAQYALSLVAYASRDEVKIISSFPIK